MKIVGRYEIVYGVTMSQKPDDRIASGVTPEYVAALTQPASGFLCALTANTYGLEFVGFAIRDAESGRCLFELRQEEDHDSEDGVLEEAPVVSTEGIDPTGETDAMLRTIRYHFGPAFLDLKSVGTRLEFAVGAQEVRNLRMIERHYFRGRLLKSFDFTFPFCPPNTVNTWEFIYEMPELDAALKEELIFAPYETQSDSFYFVDGTLVMHNKAEYSFAR